MNELVPAAYQPGHLAAPAPGGRDTSWLWRAVRFVGPPSLGPAAILVASYSAAAGGAAHSVGDAAIAGLLVGAAGVAGVLLRRHQALAATCLGAAGAIAEFAVGAYTTNMGLRVGYAIVAAVLAGSLRYLLGRGTAEKREVRAAALVHKQIESATTITVEQVRANAAVERTRIKQDAATRREALRAQTAMSLGYDPYAAQSGGGWTGPALGRSLRELLLLDPEAQKALSADPGTAALLAPVWRSAAPDPRRAAPPDQTELPGNYL